MCITSNDKTKILFTPQKLGSIKYSKYWFLDCIVAFDSYLFHLDVRLNHDLNGCNSFELSLVDKVATVTWILYQLLQMLLHDLQKYKMV